MTEFKDKVDQYKQSISGSTIVDEGFKTQDGLPEMDSESPLTDFQNVRADDGIDESHQDIDRKQKDKKVSGKTVSSLKKRLDQVVHEKNIREAQTQELLARVQEQERRLSEQQSILEQNEQYKNAYYENNLQTREQAILNELKVAKEEGDIDKEINLSKELAKVAADQSTYGLYKSQLRNKPNYDRHENTHPEPTYGREPYYSHDNYEEPINEAYDSWLEKNPWADPESRNYSPRLRDEATNLANELDEMLRYNGNSDFIGTSEYFQSIDNLMAERYSVKEKEPRARESQYSNVAPVSRNGSSMADQYMQSRPNDTRRHMPLTEDEYKIARNLQIKLPNGEWASSDECVRRYAEAKRLKNPDGSLKIRIGE